MRHGPSLNLRSSILPAGVSSEYVMVATGGMMHEACGAISRKRDNMSALIDTKQIADMLGCTREHVTNRLTKRPDFPTPRVNLSQRLRRWSEAEVVAWMQSQRQAA